MIAGCVSSRLSKDSRIVHFVEILTTVSIPVPCIGEERGGGKISLVVELRHTHSQFVAEILIVLSSQYAQSPSHVRWRTRSGWERNKLPT